MRKINPVDVKTDFISGLNKVQEFYEAAADALQTDSHQTLLVENTLLSVAVLWEGFLSDLIVAYINRNSSRFAHHLKDALATDQTPKQALILKHFSTVNVPFHLNKDMIIELLDSQGNNITFSTYSALADKSSSWLTSQDAEKISKLPGSDQAIMDTLIAIRNHIAHRSERSYKTMNTALSKGALHATGLKRGVKNIKHVGVYLKSRPVGMQTPRINIFLDSLNRIAALI